jgi:hypothetical protein
MGFHVSEEVSFPKLGVSAANTYVTIKATFTHFKQGTNAPMMFPGSMSQASNSNYTLSTRFMVYAYNPADPPNGQSADISPLREDFIYVGKDTVSADPIADLYTAIKLHHFSGKTYTDHL